MKWRGRGRVEWAYKNFTLGIEEIYTAGFRDYTPNADPAEFGTQYDHWVEHRWITDMQASYSLIFEEPTEQNPVAGYSKGGKDMTASKSIESMQDTGMPAWKRALNNTTITVGCRNVFDKDPPQAFGFGGNSTNYPAFIYTAENRFIYASLNKKF